jgi:hypothetical protein
VIDFVRVACIVVVVLWHWVFSITQWGDHGQLVMPNLISHVDGLWATTWILQIMPAFFLVGGYANMASWNGCERIGGTRAFWRRRLRRLLRPVAALIAVWVVIDAVLVAIGGSRANVLRWGTVTVPLWFLGVYVGVVRLVPFTARLHERFGLAVPLVLVAGMVVAGRGLVTRHSFGSSPISSGTSGATGGSREEGAVASAVTRWCSSGPVPNPSGASRRSVDTPVPWWRQLETLATCSRRRSASRHWPCCNSACCCWSARRSSAGYTAAPCGGSSSPPTASP